MDDTQMTNSAIPGAVELAQMQMPRMYLDVERPNIIQRVANRLLAKPGPKPRIKAYSYRGKTPPQLHSTMRRIGEYREDPVSLETYDLIRNYAVVKLALVARAAPIFTSLREVKVDGSNEDINAFIKKVFVEEWIIKLAKQTIIPSYAFGIAPNEIVWQSVPNLSVEYVDSQGIERVAWNGPALTIGEFRFIHPMSLKEIVIKKDGTKDYNGLIQWPAPGQDDLWIPPGKTLHYVNNFLWAGLWGESELRSVYPAWYYAEFFRALQADYLRFKVIPPLVGYAPPGTRIDENGVERDNMEVAGEVLAGAFANMVVVLPDERDDRGNQQWSYKEVETANVSDTYTKAIEELEVYMLRAMLVPERTVTQNAAAVGSYNQAQEHAERMVDMAKLETDFFLEMVNEHILPKLIVDHFGPDAPPVKIRAHNLSEALKEKLQTIVLTILQNDKYGIYAQQVAFQELLEFVGIPWRTGGREGLPEPIFPEPAMGASQDEKNDDNESVDNR